MRHARGAALVAVALGAEESSWRPNSHQVVQIQGDGLEAFSRPAQEKQAAICITGALRRVQLDALRSWAHVKYPLNAALYLTVSGTEEERKPLSDARKLVYNVFTSGILDGVALIADPFDSETIEERLELAGMGDDGPLQDVWQSWAAASHSQLRPQLTAWNLGIQDSGNP